MLVPEEAELTLCPEGATDTEFVVVVQSGEVDRLRPVASVCPAGSGGPSGLPPVDLHRHVFRPAARGPILVRTRPQRGGGRPQNGCTEQWVLWVPEVPEIFF